MTLCFSLDYKHCPLGSSECASECLIDPEHIERGEE